MRLLFVNVGMPREIAGEEGPVRTGIFKAPMAGRVMLRKLNLEGDGQGDLQAHGGVDKAVYAYMQEHYPFWARELGRDDLAPGQFGENLTVEAMPEDAVHIGDVFRVGGAVVQVTQPRTPCYKLGLKMGSAEFPKRFLDSLRTGFYLRVLEEGEVGAGDPIACLCRDPERLAVRELVRAAYFDRDDVETAQKALRVAALAPGWRRRFEERLRPNGGG